MTGTWKDGVKNGDVIIEYHNGDRFHGFCFDDKIAGEGELVCKNGYKYKGQWKDNLVRIYGCSFSYRLNLLKILELNFSD